MKKKDFGQHFLVDKNIISDELGFADLIKDDIVLEIGPGKGALTIPMATQVKQVIAIEKDEFLYEYLSDILPDNVLLIRADALTYDFSNLPWFNKIISNLPYKISSPITFNLLSLEFEKAILMYQMEFAQRMIAKPLMKHYSRLSVNVYYYAQCNMLKKVSRNCFYPKPNVDSGIIQLTPRNKPAFQVKNEQLFFQVVKELFNHRRKKIKNIIKKKYNIDDSKLPFANNRVEVLTPEQIGMISDFLSA
jgi:16S rRNA (adenine1518-N6/adenine1519-N6)-dimethyltransferase